MNLHTLLRASLIPLGAALVHRGLSELHAEADELRELVAARRAYLAGDGPLPVDDDPTAAAVDEHQDDDDEPGPENFRSAAAPAPAAVEKSSVRPRHLAAAAAGFGLGWLAVAALRRRAALADLAALARSAALVTMPPAPGSPADLAARDPFDTVRSVRLVDEHQAADPLDEVEPRPGADRDPHGCQFCTYVPKVGRSDEQRAVDVALHRNRAHAAGLPG